MMRSALVTGAAAGAAGTSALNAATYLDMVLRARPPSPLPKHAVETLMSNSGHPLGGTGEKRDHRLEGLGALSGIGTGVGIGAAAGVLAPILLRLPLLAAAALVGAGAMAATDLPMARLGLTDPSSWSAADWASDAIPHLVYGLVTAGVVRSSRFRTRR